MTDLKLIHSGQLSDEQLFERLLAQIPHKKYWIDFEMRPGIAAMILERLNKNNRTRKPKSISTYAKYMAAKNWAATGQAIIFSEQGRLLDGQNRLMACLQSGSTFRTDVRFGITDDAFKFLDQGKMRSNGDILQVAGYPNSNRLGRAVRWAYLIDERIVKTRKTLDSPFILHLLQERYHDLQPFIQPAVAVYNVTGQPDGMVAALLYHFSRANKDKAEAFATAWASGAWSDKYGAIGKMQKAVANLSSVSNQRPNDVVRAAVIVRAWNNFVHGKSGKRDDYQWSLVEDFPTIER